MRPDSLWTNPLDCPFGKWGARYASAGRLVARPLVGILSARAPDPFPKRAGDLSALRMAAAVCGSAVLFFRAAKAGEIVFLCGCLEARQGATPHPLRGSSPLRRGAKAWRVAKLDFFKDCRPLRQERAVARAPGLLIAVPFTATINAYPGSGPAGPAREGGRGGKSRGGSTGGPVRGPPTTPLWP